MAAKLKVFVTSVGLTEYAVATTSRPKALAAWGVNQDLFAQGAARETDEPALVKAATASPGEVVERPVNSKVLASALKAPKPARRGPSEAARKKVAELEKALEALQGDHRARLDSLAEARAGLDAREEREAEAYEAERKRLSARLSKARR